MIPCPHCAHPKTWKMGDRRRKCPNCGKTFAYPKLSENGRPPIFGVKLTPYEKLRRYLDKKKKDKDKDES